MAKYIAKYDSNERVWRIIDIESPIFKALNPDEDIPDNCPAMKILNGDEVNILVTEFRKQFPERFEVIKTNQPKDENKQIKDLIVEVVKGSKTTEDLLAKTLAFETLMKRMKE